MLIENRFPERFDINIICLQGFSTEAGRKILKSLEDSGFKVYVLHDYDINGVLIHETLTRPTKRREIFVSRVVDLGFNWNDVQEFMKRGIIPEPVRLSKQDSSKLDGMLDRGSITPEEYDFLKNYRVELNALTPLEFLEWLKNKFEKLGIWKVIPSEKELANSVMNIAKLKVEEELREKFSLNELRDVYIELGGLISDFLQKEDDLFRVDVDLQEFIELLKQNELLFWTLTAHYYAENKLDGKKDEIIQELINRGLKEHLKEAVEKLERIVNEIKTIIGL